MFFIPDEGGEYLVEKIEEDERGDRYGGGSRQALLEGLHAGWDNRHMVFHEPGKGQGKRLPTDDDVPAHHEDPEEDQQTGEAGPTGTEARQKKENEREDVADSVLEYEYFDEVLVVDDLANDVPRLDRRIAAKNDVEEFEGNGQGHE